MERVKGKEPSNRRNQNRRRTIKLCVFGGPPAPRPQSFAGLDVALELQRIAPESVVRFGRRCGFILEEAYQKLEHMLDPEHRRVPTQEMHVTLAGGQHLVARFVCKIPLILMARDRRNRHEEIVLLRARAFFILDGLAHEGV